MNCRNHQQRLATGMFTMIKNVLPTLAGFSFPLQRYFDSDRFRFSGVIFLSNKNLINPKLLIKFDKIR